MPSFPSPPALLRLGCPLRGPRAADAAVSSHTHGAGQESTARRSAPTDGAAEELWLNELPRRLENVPEPQKRAATLRLFGERALARPLQYAFVGTTQVLRMPFWESTQIGYVEYPPWLDRVYSAGIVRNGLRLLVGVWTFLALAFAVARAASPCRKASASGDDRRREPAAALVLFIAASFMALYAPYSVLTCYALPIAPLYVLLVAKMVDDVVSRRSRTH